MTPRRLWLLGVTTTAAVCLLCASQGTDSLMRSRVGGTAELNCSLAPPTIGGPAPQLFPLHVVEWVRLGYSVPILIKFGVYAPRVHPDYKGRVSLVRGASLLVQGLRLEDEGWFECRILLLERDTDEFHNGTWTYLSITAPPIFIKTPPPFLEALQGDPLTLACSAHGNPRPTVSWLKDDAPAEKQDGVKAINGTLYLATVTREMAGMYECHVSNMEGNLTHTAQLLVKGPPVIIVPPKDTTLNMSQDAVLQCHAQAYPANLSYLWLKEGENVYHLDSLRSRAKVLVDGSLLIPHLIPDDAGNYTCTPSNGLLTPPTASAYLTVRHPAQVVRMPRETYLPTGMGGVIACPVRAEPPVLYVNWTKDGDVLDLDMYPGWMVNSEGAVFVATANDNAVGVYTCTAYNSYGTMGRSEPTSVFLQDPPSFKVAPRAEYLQEVGRDLVIPCQANGEPAPNVTWIKVGPAPRTPYTIASNGSLILRPVGKDHQGDWECHATNRVAKSTTRTIVLVLGTSPHAVSAVAIVPGAYQANVTWEPGFDGGYVQKFSVWLRQASRGHEWTSLPVPPFSTSLLVTALLPATSYQFSILPQNKLGSGPFSEIINVRTLVAATDPPVLVTETPKLAPPSSLLANQTSRGIVLRWLAPPPQALSITGFLLQVRPEKGDWRVLSGAISANSSEVLVQGILKDTKYDLRLLSLRNEATSEPSEPVSVSTEGMDVYPARASLLEFIPEPLLAGVVGGVCFLFVAIFLSLATTCIMSHRRERRRRRRRDDLPTALPKSPPPEAGSPSDSPDSVLKMKLCPPISFFPGSSSSQSDRTSFDKGSRSEYQDQRQQLLASPSPPPRYALFESHLGGELPSRPSALESISRGPDGRFIVQPYEESSIPAHLKRSQKEFPQQADGRSSTASVRTSYRSSPSSDSSYSQKEGKRDRATVLAVDLPDHSRPQQSPGRVKAMARNFSRHGCFHSGDKQGYSEGLLDGASLYSEGSEKRSKDSIKKHSGYWEDPFHSLRKQAREAVQRQDRKGHSPSSCFPAGRDSQATHTDMLMPQVVYEEERDNLSKCLKLVQEREEMEKQLQRYTCSRTACDEKAEDMARVEVKPAEQRQAGAEEEPVWKVKGITLRPKVHRASGQAHQLSDYRKGCYFGSTSSPVGQTSASSEHIHWDISPVSSITGLVPMQSPLEKVPKRSSWLASPQGRTTAEDSQAVEWSQSPTTQCTSLSFLSPHLGSSPQLPGDLKDTKSRYPERTGEAEMVSSHGSSQPADVWREGLDETFKLDETTKQESGVESRNLGSPEITVCHKQQQNAKEQSPVTDLQRDRQKDVRIPCQLESNLQNIPETLEGKDREREQNHSESSTLPYELQKAGEKERPKEAQTSRAINEQNISLISPEMEKEGVRTRSRKSDKCLYSDSPSRVSPLTLLENDGENDQTVFTVHRMSDSFKSKLAPQPSKMSLLQTSAILEYLSLPGFIEMSVDGPDDENSASAWPDLGQKTYNFLQEAPDIVPKCRENHSTILSQTCTSDIENSSSGPPGTDSGLEGRCFLSREPQDSRAKVQNSGKTLKLFSSSEEKAEDVYHMESWSHLTDLKSITKVHRDDTGLCVSSASTLVNTGNEVAGTVFSVPDPFTDSWEPPFVKSQRPETQDCRSTNVVSRISQAPVPLMKKSVSMVPSKPICTAGQPGPQLKKSISLGLHHWEHYEGPQPCTYERRYHDEFLHPDMRPKSSNLGQTSGHLFHSRHGPFLQGRVNFQPQSHPNFKCPLPAEVSVGSQQPPIADPLQPYALASGIQQSDPRRQASAFPEASRWPVTYQDALRSAQHRTAAHDHSIYQTSRRPGMRREYIRPSDSRWVAQRPFLPRGYSWPSPHHSTFVHHEPERKTGRCAELANREHDKVVRASFASQSSGRGSVGPVFVHATEQMRHSAAANVYKSTLAESTRRNISVDDGYERDEMDFPVNSDNPVRRMSHGHEGQGRVRGHQRRDRPHSTLGFRDFQSREVSTLPHPGLFSWASPPMCNPSRGPYGPPLSEARFNALRLEYQRYCKAQDLSHSHNLGLTPEPDSDPDSNTALL